MRVEDSHRLALLHEYTPDKAKGSKAKKGQFSPDFRNEVALAVYMPDWACDRADLIELCSAGGRHLRVVVDVVASRPCLLPVVIPPRWYVIRVDKPVATACTEYIWTFNVQGEPPYTQTYGCE